MQLFIDIETIPARDAKLIARMAEDARAPSNYGEEAAAKWKAKNRDKVAGSSGLNPFMGGEVSAIAFAVGEEGEVHGRMRGRQELEQTFLEDTFALVGSAIATWKIDEGIPEHSKEEVQWIGHYITGFDIPFLFGRALITGADMGMALPVGVRHGTARVFDTHTAISSWKTLDHCSLRHVAYMMHWPYVEMTPDQAFEWFLAGDDQLKQRCMSDVLLCRELYTSILAAL